MTAEVGQPWKKRWTRRLFPLALGVASALVALRLLAWLLGIGAMEHRVRVDNRSTETLAVNVWLSMRSAPVWRFPAVPAHQSRTITAKVQAGTHYEVRVIFPDGEEVPTRCGYQDYRFHDVVVTVLPSRFVFCTHTQHGGILSW